jgi:hypothetical protein
MACTIVEYLLLLGSKWFDLGFCPLFYGILPFILEVTWTKFYCVGSMTIAVLTSNLELSYIHFKFFLQPLPRNLSCSNPNLMLLQIRLQYIVF